MIMKLCARNYGMNAFAAYYGGGIGPALMDALSVDDMSPEELMKTARLWGGD